MSDLNGHKNLTEEQQRQAERLITLGLVRRNFEDALEMLEMGHLKWSLTVEDQLRRRFEIKPSSNGVPIEVTQLFVKTAARAHINEALRLLGMKKNEWFLVAFSGSGNNVVLNQIDPVGSGADATVSVTSVPQAESGKLPPSEEVETAEIPTEDLKITQ